MDNREVKERIEHENTLYKKLYEKNQQLLTLLYRVEELEEGKDNAGG